MLVLFKTRGSRSLLLPRCDNLRFLSQPKKMRIRLDEFAYRQFDDPDYSGTKISMKKEEFMQKVEQLIPTHKFTDGYAPFCKHLFVPNFEETVCVGEVKITPENEHLLKSGYIARTEKELAVLARWFPKGSVVAPKATHLDLIFYSYEQIVKEAKAMNLPEPPPDFDWGLIAIKGQSIDYEAPMSPITAMRNALGVAEGGSGIPLNREEYNKSVAYWQQHAMVK